MPQTDPPGAAGRDTAGQDLRRYVLGKAQAPTPKRRRYSLPPETAGQKKEELTEPIDLYFTATKPISEYAAEARTEQRIVA